MDTTTKRLAIHSDFHVENSGHGTHLRPRIGSADILVVAGDISPPCYQLMKKGRHGALAWLRQATGFDGPIVFVMGNNDFNHYPYDEVIESLRAEAQEYDVHFLHNEVAIVEGIEFIGTPLFTDMSLPGVDPKDIAKGMEMKLSAFNHKRFERDYCVCMRSPFCAAEHWQEESYPRGTLLADGNRGGREWFANEHDKAMNFLRGHWENRPTRPGSWCHTGHLHCAALCPRSGLWNPGMLTGPATRKT